MTKEVGSVNAYSDFDCQFEWQINGFSRIIESKNVGEALHSPKFITEQANGNIDWFLQLYPKGHTSDYKDYLSLFVFSTADISAMVSFIILNNSGRVIISQTYDRFWYGNSKGNGNAKLIPLGIVLSPEYGILENDKLAVVCRIKYFNNKIKSPILGYGNKAKKRKIKEEFEDSILLPRLEDDFEALLDDNEFSDVRLVSEGKTVKVHKCILAKRSAVFAAMFNNEMKEKKENVVEISDIRFDVLMEMLRFVYAGKVNNVDALAAELAIAADKYALDGLKITCERAMSKNLNSNNVVECLQIADKIRMDKLAKYAIEFIVDKGIDVTEKSEYGLLPPNLVRKILSRSLTKNL